MNQEQVMITYHQLLEEGMKGRQMVDLTSPMWTKLHPNLTGDALTAHLNQLKEQPYVVCENGKIGITDIPFQAISMEAWETFAITKEGTDILKGVYAHLLTLAMTQQNKIRYVKQDFMDVLGLNNTNGLTRAINKLKQLKALKVMVNEADEVTTLVLMKYPSGAWLTDALSLTLTLERELVESTGVDVEPTPKMTPEMTDDVAKVEPATEAGEEEEPASWEAFNDNPQATDEAETLNPIALEFLSAFEKTTGEAVEQLIPETLKPLKEVHLLETLTAKEYAILWWVIQETPTYQNGLVPAGPDVVKDIYAYERIEIVSAVQRLKSLGLVEHILPVGGVISLKLLHGLEYYRPYLNAQPADYDENTRMANRIKQLNSDAQALLLLICDKTEKALLNVMYDIDLYSKELNIGSKALRTARQKLEKHRMISLAQTGSKCCVQLHVSINFVRQLLVGAVAKSTQALSLTTIDAIQSAQRTNEPAYRFLWYLFQYAKLNNSSIPGRGLTHHLKLSPENCDKAKQYWTTRGVVRTHKLAGEEHLVFTCSLSQLESLVKVVPNVFKMDLPITLRQAGAFDANDYGHNEALTESEPDLIPVEEAVMIEALSPIVTEVQMPEPAPVTTTAPVLVSPVVKTPPTPAPLVPVAPPQATPKAADWTPPKRFFIVDTENISSKGYESLMTLTESDTIILLLTLNSTRLDAISMHYLFMTKASKESFFLKPNGKNSLDHAVSGEAYIQLIRHPESICYIVSNDQGYRTGIEHMIQRLNLNPNQLRLVGKIA